MNTSHFDPAHLTADQLITLGAPIVFRLARQAAGTLTGYRLLLGRCLLAIDRYDLHDDLGCSSTIHYAVSHLGMEADEARQFRRVAHQLESLPILSFHASNGQIAWSKLREVVRVATPEDEAQWLKACQTHTYAQVERLVRRARQGAREAEFHQFSMTLSPEVNQLLQRTMQCLSQQAGRPLQLAEGLELLCADYLSQHGLEVDPEKDLAAEQECSARNISSAEVPTDVPTEENRGWEVALAAREVPCPENSEVKLVAKQQPHWRNPKLRFNPKSRHPSEAQRNEILRRDAYRCQTPGCPHHLFLEVHHIQYYIKGGATIDENLLCICSHCHANVHKGLLFIEGTPSSGLIFRDRHGRNLATQRGLSVGGWLNFYLGWFGEWWDSHQHRFARGELAWLATV